MFIYIYFNLLTKQRNLWLLTITILLNSHFHLLPYICHLLSSSFQLRFYPPHKQSDLVGSKSDSQKSLSCLSPPRSKPPCTSNTSYCLSSFCPLSSSDSSPAMWVTMDLAACMPICLADITSCVNISLPFPSAVIKNYDSLLINIDHMFKHLPTRHYSCGKHHKITTKNFPISKFNIDVLLLKFLKLIL
jgi:hypothetical protein